MCAPPVCVCVCECERTTKYIVHHTVSLYCGSYSCNLEIEQVAKYLVALLFEARIEKITPTAGITNEMNKLVFGT